MKKSFFMLLIYTIVIFTSAAVPYSACAITQLTNNYYYDYQPQINNNGHVIWLMDETSLDSYAWLDTVADTDWEIQ